LDELPPREAAPNKVATKPVPTARAHLPLSASHAILRKSAAYNIITLPIPVLLIINLITLYYQF
jgi:hypothetical protein